MKKLFISQPMNGKTDDEILSERKKAIEVAKFIVNDNIEDDMYNTLFINAWFNYYKYWTSREALLQMRGNSWKDDFNNVLMA